ncbi:BTAD domain-containing putative transcriptional regulator [Micromonospora tulbaghiae]|uniref:Transcriptional regulatory protein, C terminal n=1 Tax=Micromonospora tulbaghiae TaxID=479978 RepID=A0ABY0KML5_9ACTN|nr:BTAD domain-containing putative transcriptional regulator [Micromonospora tulbaghiae]MDX5459224.1 AAA family ATPase [Micromonospora tulbaghiae]SCE73740.1 Transcriptional regulatory protein, C terminal [Micromonospora tulbaghiae]
MTVQFRVLGPPEVVRNGRVVPLGGPKQQALLALFLLRPNRFVAADWLVDALWDARPPASAQTTLRTYVAGLRRAVEPERSHREPARILRSHPRGYELRVDSDAVDATRFGALVDRAADALAAGQPAAAERTYTEALALWRGEPLAGVADLAAVRPEAARLAELRLSAEEGRLTAAVAAGRHATLLPELRRFVSANPLREGARAQLMLALYRSGRQTEALAVFDEGRRILAGEYGLDPGEQIRTVHRLILEQAVPPDHSSPADAGHPVEAGRAAWPERDGGPLVGRDAELERLREALDAATGHSGRVLTLVGEAGIGKTSLAAALGARATATGVPVVWGRCPDVGQAPPFWLWSQVVRALVAMPQAHATGSASRLDGFAAGAPSGPADGRGLDPTARFQVYEAVAELVHAAARERGLLVVLDDLHAADPDSLLLLRFLAAALPASRALVVATLRPYDDDPALVATVAELVRGPGFGQVRLAGLDAAAVADLVRDRTGEAPPEPVVTRLVTRTGGNPFFLTELLRSRTDPGTDPELPPNIRDTVRLRLAGLPGPTRRCLDLLSVAGHDLDLAVLAAALDSTAEAVAEELAPAYPAALVVETGPGALAFRHPLIAEVTYAELVPPRRAALHARLAAAYEQSAGTAPAELAHHYGEAVGLGHGEDHLRWSLRAADDATRRVAYEDALGHLERAALRLAPSARVTPDAAVTELTVQLHRAALLQMTVGIGSDAVDRVCARARELLTLVGPETDIRHALWVLGELAANRAEFAICADLAGRLVRAPDDGSGLIAVAGEYLLGAIGYFTGRQAEGERRLTAGIDRLRAVDRALLRREVGRRPVLACHNFRALVRSMRGDPAGAWADIAAAEALAEELDDPYGRANAALYAAWLAMQEHDVAAADAAGRRCRDIGRATGLPHMTATGAYFLEWAAARGGDHGRLDAMRAAAEEFYRPGLRSTRTITLCAMAEAYLTGGRPDTAATLAEEALALADRVGEHVFVAELHRIRGAARRDRAAWDLGARIAADQGAGLLLPRFAAF